MPVLEPGRIRLWWFAAPSVLRAAPVLGGAALLAVLAAGAMSPAPPPVTAAPDPAAATSAPPARPAPPPSSAAPALVARAGERCARLGERAVTKAGKELRCVRKAGERRPSWRVG